MEIKDFVRQLLDDKELQEKVNDLMPDEVSTILI